MGAPATATFNKIQLPRRPDKIDDGTWELVRTLVDQHNDVVVKSNKNNEAFKRAAQIGAPTIIVGAFGTSAGGATGSLVFSNKGKRINLATGTTFVPFEATISPAPMIAVLRCTGKVEGEDTNVIPLIKDGDIITTGFTVKVDTDCNLEYIPIPTA